MHDDEVNLKGIVVFLGVLAVTLTVVYAILTAMWRGFERRAQTTDEQALRESPVPSAGQPYFPLPREQPHPAEDLVALRAREETELNSYGWIDRTNGIVRIPINRAMDLLTQPSGGNR
jgi:hypothetical protein